MIHAFEKTKRPDIAPYDGHRASAEISASIMAWLLPNCNAEVWNV